jgi:hypothetical protein
MRRMRPSCWEPGRIKLENRTFSQAEISSDHILPRICFLAKQIVCCNVTILFACFIYSKQQTLPHPVVSRLADRVLLADWPIGLERQKTG